MKQKWFIGIVIGVMMLSCSPRAVREAKSVVAQADSLWQAGMPCDDSIALTEAFTTLDTYQFLYPDDYAHACYHYGRLLREKENPVEAMLVFIHATHSHTRDYHILGRVYSNMGDICHLANEFDLSYDMYKCSGVMFLRNGDTLNYYYALNDMAFELAEQGKIQETKNLLCEICTDKDPYICALKALTIAKAFAENNQYDSVLCALKQSPNYYALHYVLMANAFWHMDYIDSSLYYAKKVLTSPDATEQNKYNMLYIILNHDSTLRNEDIIALSAQRSDIETDILIPLHNQWAMAIQLLEQDLTHETDWLWLYVLITTLAIMGSSCFIYVYRKRKRQELLSQKIDILEKTTTTIQEKHQELTERYLIEYKRIEDRINSRCSMLQTNESIKKILAWRDYKKMCNIVDKQFYLLASKLRDKHSLKETEIRICILTLLNCGSEQMAELLYKSPTSIGTLKRRVANKLGTTSGEMRKYLIDNVCIK